MPTPPVRHPAPSKLDPYKPKILERPAEDRHVWQKQQHTAKRILDRLREEEGFDSSYSIVQRYVKSVPHACRAHEPLWLRDRVDGHGAQHSWRASLVL